MVYLEVVIKHYSNGKNRKDALSNTLFQEIH